MHAPSLSNKFVDVASGMQKLESFLYKCFCEVLVLTVFRMTIKLSHEDFETVSGILTEDV